VGAEEDRAASAASAVAVAAAAPAGKVEGDAASTPGKDGGAAAGSSLVVAEDRAVGSVSLATLAAYLEAAGGAPVISLLFFVLFLSKGLTVFSSAYLSYWSMGGARMGIPPLFGPPGAPSSHDSLLYAAVYAGLVGLVVLLNFVQGLLFSVATLAASKRLHSTVFRSVLRARIDWHDSQPTGRTLARFTGDVDTVDSTLPSTLETCLEFLTNCLFSVVLIVCIFPGFLAVLLPLLCLFVFITDLFRRVARELLSLIHISEPTRLM
jgi:ABC-type multidrug transport system fused ATPase/permease subunit